MGLKTVEPERTPEPLGIAKTNGETVATTSNYRNLSIHLHTEEATGSIPVSPTTAPASVIPPHQASSPASQQSLGENT